MQSPHLSYSNQLGGIHLLKFELGAVAAALVVSSEVLTLAVLCYFVGKLAFKAVCLSGEAW